MFHREIAEKWDISQEMVQGINTGRYWKQDREYPIQKISLLRKAKKEYRCKDCGVLVSKGKDRCLKCAGFINRKVERPTREELKRLIRTKPFTQIGKLYGVNDNAIRRWCDAENLPRRKKDIEKYSDKEWKLI